MKLKNLATVLIFFFILAGFLGGILVWRQAFINDAIIETGDILRIGGSTTLYPHARTAARSFMAENPTKIVTVLESSSGGGLAQLLAGQVDLANTTRLPQEKEMAAARLKGKNLVAHKIGHEALALVVHPSKYPFVSALTQTQARAIFFDGTISDWSQLHPSLSGPIHVYVRDAENSGTAATFNELVMGNAEASYHEGVIPTYLTPLIVSAVETDPDGIAYTPTLWITERVKALAYGETGTLVRPTEETATNGSYVLTTTLYIVSLGEPTPTAKAYLAFVLSAQGQALLQESGLFSRTDKPKNCDYLSKTVC